MSIKRKVLALALSGLAVVTCVAALGLGSPNLAQAQGTTPPAAGTPAPSTPNADTTRQLKGNAQYLADALGVTVGDLQSAQAKARNAAIDAAVAAGSITQSQADAMKNGQRGARYNLGLTAAQQEQFLADALNVTVARLQAAVQAAHKAELDQAVASGRITQAQEDLLLGERALQKYIADKGLFEAAVQSAVSDGVLTQAQADAILNQAKNGRDGFGFFGKGGAPGGLGDFGGHGMGLPGPRGGFRGGLNGPRGGANPSNQPAPTAQPSL